MAAHDPAASREFVSQWDSRIKSWVAGRATYENVEEAAELTFVVR